MVPGQGGAALAHCRPRGKAGLPPGWEERLVSLTWSILIPCCVSLNPVESWMEGPVYLDRTHRET